MNRLTRRALFAVSGRTTAAALAISVLSGCSLISSTTPSQLQQDVTTLADGLSGIVGALQSLPANLQPSPDVVAKIQTEIDAIKADAAAIGSTANPSSTTVQRISTAVGIVASLVGPFFPAAPMVAMVVQAALAILPVILSAVGIATAAAAPQKYTPGQARMILKGAAVTVLQ